MPRKIPVFHIVTRHSANCPKKDEGPTFRRCNCWKHLRYFHPVDKKMTYEATHQRTWSGAELYRQERLKKYGQEPSAAAVSVRAAVDQFLDDKRGQNISLGVVKKYELELQRFVDFCHAQDLRELRQVSQGHLSAYRSGWEALYPSSTTRQQVQGRLISFYKYCESAGHVAKNIARGLSTIKITRPPTLPLTAEQYAQLITAIPEVFRDKRKQTRVRALLQLMCNTGLAIRDAVCLPRIALQKGETGNHVIVTRRCKNQSEQYVPLEPTIVSEIMATPNRCPDYFFWGTGKGRPQTAVSHWQHDLRKLFRSIGMQEGHPHQLRDTFAVNMLNKGIPLETVSRMLGHQSVRTTEKYYSPWVSSRKKRLEEVVCKVWEPQSDLAISSSAL
jgi:site-specific recombinase XerD